MRALRQMSLNGPRDLRSVTDAPVPVPGPDEILIRVTAAGVLTPGQPTAYGLADGPKALAELENRATVGKLALLPVGPLEGGDVPVQ